MTDTTSDPYLAIRARFVDVVGALTEEQTSTTVPACPEWSVKDLFIHVVSMPMSILAGDLPGESGPEQWIHRLIDDNRSRDIADLVAWWSSNDDALAGLMGNARLLTTDLFVHEGDLRAALGLEPLTRPPELHDEIDASLLGLTGLVQEAGLPPVAVDLGGKVSRTADGQPGWLIEADPWESFRALSSRRTADELRALPCTGDAEDYIGVLDRHLPLPNESLGEQQP